MSHSHKHYSALTVNGPGHLYGPPLREARKLGEYELTRTNRLLSLSLSFPLPYCSKCLSGGFGARFRGAPQRRRRPRSARSYQRRSAEPVALGSLAWHREAAGAGGLEPSRLRAAPTLGRVEHSHSLQLLRSPRHPSHLPIWARIGAPAIPTLTTLRVEMRPLGRGPGPGSRSRKAQAEPLLGWGAGSALTRLTRGELAILSTLCCVAKRTAGTGDPRLHPRAGTSAPRTPSRLGPCDSGSLETL